LRSFGSRDDVSSTEDVGGVVDAKSCKKTRRAFFLKDSKDLKEEAEAFKSNMRAQYGARATNIERVVECIRQDEMAIAD